MNARVLIVDDDPALLQALPETLRIRTPDIGVETCDSASVALERIVATDYDAIISDIKMPGVDGLALLDQVRVVRPDTPTLLITGHGEHDLAVESLRRGAYDYIQKPIDRDYLVASLSRAVQVRQLRRQIAAQQDALARHAGELETIVQARTQQLRETADRVRALTEVATAIHGARGVGEVLRSIVEAACRLSGASLAVAGFYRGDVAGGSGELGDERAWEVSVAPRELAERITVRQVVDLFASVCGDPRSTRIEEAAKDPRFLGWARAPVSLGSCLAVPVRSRVGAVLGALVLGHRDPRWFSPEARAQIEALALQVAVALENTLLYERTRGIAETLQRSLLPDRLPEIPGVALAARYLPGSQEAVGGDWYDVFLLPSGQVALLMGDVAGRGVWAAAVMGQLRNAVRAYALEGNPPATVGERLSRLIEPGAMATLLYMVFDPDTWEVRYLNLGHMPPLVVSPDGEARFLEGGAPPLGAVSGRAFEELTATLVPGSTVLLYTDGLVEVRGEAVDAGLARLERVARSAAGEGLDRLVERVLTEARTAPGDDDVAVLGLCAAPVPAQHVQLKLPAVPASLRQMRRTLRRWMRAAGASESEMDEVITATNEACANAVEHAYGPTDGAIEIEARLTDGWVAVTVRDAGAWRPSRGQYRGHGFKLMHALTDEVHVVSGAAGTAVELRRRLAQGVKT